MLVRRPGKSNHGVEKNKCQHFHERPLHPCVKDHLEALFQRKFLLTGIMIIFLRRLGHNEFYGFTQRHPNSFFHGSFGITTQSPPPTPDPTRTPPRLKSLASPSTLVAATILEVRVSITLKSMAMWDFLIPARTPPIASYCAPDTSANTAGTRLKLGNCASYQQFSPFNLANGCRSLLLDPS